MVIHILYSGLGGHGEYVFPLIEKKDEATETSLVFFGIETPKQEYIDWCRNRSINYTYIKKDKGLQWFWNLWLFYFKHLHDVKIIHSSIVMLPFFPARLLSLFFANRIIYVEHQSNQLKSTTDWLCTFISLIFAKKRIYLTTLYQQEIAEKFPVFRFFKRKHEIIPTGVDLNFWKRTSAGKTSNEFRMGMQGRFQAIKNFSCLIKALAILRYEKNEVGIKLVLAGDGPEMQKLRRLTNELKLDNHVEFCGMLNRNQLLEFMQPLDVYVHSTLGETLSTSILQAMAMEIPILASDVRGVNNVLSSNEAYLFKEDDAAGLADLLFSIFKDSSEAKQKSSNAFLKVKKEYSLEEMRKRYKKLIDDVSVN